MGEFSVTLAEALGLGTSLALSGFFYCLYRKSRVTVDKLDNAPQLAVDGNLKDILKVTPGACLQYAVIEGVVRPVGEPLTSHFHKETVGVLQKFMLREHSLVWNSLSRSWTDVDRVLHQRVSAVPFVLVGSDETEVRVLCPLQASGVYMETTHEKFQQSVYGFGELIGQYISGEKPKGQLEIEEMLKVGSTVTGVGELVLDAHGSLSLGPPSNGSEYFLSTRDFGALREDSQSVAVLWKAMLVASALAGAALVFWVGLRYYRHRQALWEQERERQEFERLRAEAFTPHAADRSADSEANSCVICLSRPRDCALLDCGHVCCCHACYQALPQRRCPVCRRDIVRVIPLYHT
ncbi:mitochondrial ubiquitin ligase activator of nfkb 1-A [Salarias fasciatus]|uniref:RING-type E3 ubiquitin transferase n=1 Tax=Salarias fasciatus TaxID=181472 RepID=A0A672F522_SALFA|nr:mitochondrial ubiquitin ligase activator of nfkb 1-A-like [Salarias fasciatus]